MEKKVDDVVGFPDDSNIPGILVENKVDLLKEGTKEGKDKDFKDFAKKDGFCGCFRTSAKQGTNVNESMVFLIETIIERFKSMEKNGVNISRRESIVLDSGKHSNKNECKYKCS